MEFHFDPWRVTPTSLLAVVAARPRQKNASMGLLGTGWYNFPVCNKPTGLQQLVTAMLLRIGEYISSIAQLISSRPSAISLQSAISTRRIKNAIQEKGTRLHISDYTCAHEGTTEVVVGGGSVERGCVAGAGRKLGDRSIRSTSERQSRDRSAAGINFCRSNSQKARALGNTAHLQSGGDRARWKNLRALSGGGRLRSYGDRRTYLAARSG